MDPIDPRYIVPELEIVPTEPSPTVEERLEEEFWKRNSEVPLEEIFRKRRKSNPKIAPN